MDTEDTFIYRHEAGRSHGSSYICPVEIDDGFYFAINDLEGNWIVIDDQLYPDAQTAVEVGCEWLDVAAAESSY